MYAQKLALLSLILLSTLGTQHAAAEEWKKLFQQDISTFYIDTSRIEKTVTGKNAFWLQVLIENPQELSIKPLEEVRMKQLLDCQKKAISEPVAWENRDEDGNVIETGQRPEDAIDWIPFDQLEGADEIAGMFCKS